jgi:hypothetical protein
MPGWEALQAVGLFDFSESGSEVTRLIEVPQNIIFTSSGVGELLSSENLALSSDLTMLGAAAERLSIERSANDEPEPPHLPLRVQPSDARSAFSTFACALTVVHIRQDISSISVGDVTTQTGDAIKLGVLGARSAIDMLSQFDVYVDRFADLYRASPSRYSRALEETGWLAVASAVWMATLLRLVNPSRADSGTTDYVERRDEIQRLRQLNT